jgi:nucleoid DNA-binding protein
MAKKTGKTATKAAPKPAKISAASKTRKKTEIYTTIAENVGITRKQVAGVFDVLSRMMTVDLTKPGPNKPKQFVVPGLMKVNAIYKPATPQRQGINPFTKEPTTFKAKPARTVIKIRPLKALKSAV